MGRVIRAWAVLMLLAVMPRMARMRQAVREHNIYRWAGLLLSELERIPEGSASHSTVSQVS